MNQLSSDAVEFWQSRYQEDNTPWDLGEPAPPFIHFLKEQGNKFPKGKMAVVGCGRGHDAALFGRHGFDVTGFDIVPEAIAYAQKHYGKDAAFEIANLFDLNLEHNDAFDYVVEHTLFCAIMPVQRKAYADAVYRLLKPGGVFIGIFWAHQQPDGPPYKTSREEVIELFSPHFKIQQLETTPHSIPERKDQELLGILIKSST